MAVWLLKTNFLHPNFTCNFKFYFPILIISTFYLDHNK